MAQAMRERIDQPRARAFLETAIGEMETAAKQLGDAATSPAPLPAALASEQAAYNALLKLAAHEFQVSRSQSSGKQNSSQNRQQQELDQLDLKPEEKRYETKQEAAPQQNEQQRAQLAILNRLKELAQRQQDINERLKELQTALQEAKTDAQKEELRRQLKRLREEEQQLVADVDETRQKMERPENASALAAERKQLEQTRDQAQKAAESMENGAVPEALASGTRTERELRELRDDLRKKSAGQFSEEMRAMRNDARDLSAQQDELGKQLAPEGKKTERRTLDRGPEEGLAQKFESQQTKLAELRDAMKRVSEQAEAVEPLLAKELYDTLRQNATQGTDETLKRAGQLATNGFGSQAQKFEAKARGEIEDVKKGVERAAESVLGNEAEALRTARAELDALNEALNLEIAQAAPRLAQNDVKTGEAAAGNPDGQTPTEAGAPKGTSPVDQRGKQDGSSNEDSVTPKGGLASGKNPDEQRAESSTSNQGGGQGEQPTEAESKGEGAAGRGEGKAGEGVGQQASVEGAPGREGGGASAEKTLKGKGESGASSGEGSEGSRPGEGLRKLTANSRAGSGNGVETGGGGNAAAGPIGGGGFVEWSDRLRNVEEMLDQPALRNEAAQVREAARGIRAESKKNAEQPSWDDVRSKISKPLVELRNRVAEELARRDSKESLVPIDRDPVPARFAEQVRKYYEDLGRSAPR